MNLENLISSCDLIIIGAGPSGLSGARKAISLNKRVLMIDWGTHTYPHFSARLESEIDFEVGGLGGSAGHWGGQFGFLTKEDKHNWKTISKFDEKFFLLLEDEYYGWAQRLGTKNIEISKKENRLNFSEKPIFRETFTIIPEVWEVLPMFQDTISNPNFKYIGDKRLKYIEETESGGRKLIFESESIDVPNIPIILAMGCMETTSVIYNSLTRSGRIRSPKLGHYLADHPWTHGKTYVPSRIFGKQPPALFYEGKKRKYETSLYREEEGLFQSGIFEIRETVGKMFLNPISKNFYRFNNIWAITLYLFGLKKYSQIVRREYQIWIQLEQFRNPDSYIEFNEGLNTPHWKMSSNDIDLLNRVTENAEFIMKQYSVKERDPKTQDKEPIFNQAFHPSGTIQVGPANAESITDHYGKLYEFEKIWVASSAMFPTSGWWNPSLLIMAYSSIVVEKIFKSERSKYGTSPLGSI
jgi:hypothetical protein